MSVVPTFKVRGLASVLGALNNLEKQSRFGIARAITKTAKATEDALKREMRSKTDRPTPYFLRSTFVQPATRDKLRARVGIKDQAFSKNRLSSAQMFGHHFEGGGRATKVLEQYLRRAGLLGFGEFVAPGAGARLDAYGNMSRGQVQQILSQLRIGPDRAAFKSNSRRSKRNAQRAGRIFWARGNARDGHLKRGAYIDMGPPVGLRPLLVVIRSPSYKRRFDLPQLAATTIAKTWKDNLNASLIEAFNSAK
ncbi:hypothetical protein [Ferribacterium limneticum]|uniref:hypothetical protein n=1 Tax=Ferribacterium limneticum TaxID=76259 RepID=UPI001CF94269|nr:hypothetical protein [Ferribacterium limneticum]UCV29382.1 hypothetical protein KI617_04595 [Ferribacterium limneticum]UCV33301.1 hypothetical protein KI608_04595 [Ferribacterium limneticum]